MLILKVGVRDLQAELGAAAGIIIATTIIIEEAASSAGVARPIMTEIAEGIISLTAINQVKNGLSLLARLSPLKVKVEEDHPIQDQLLEGAVQERLTTLNHQRDLLVSFYIK